MTEGIESHEGVKYLRTIHPADGQGEPIRVDVYAVLESFGVACPGRQQAAKKILCSGHRGKGDALADLIGARAALDRAIDLERDRKKEYDRTHGVGRLSGTFVKIEDRKSTPVPMNVEEFSKAVMEEMAKEDPRKTSDK